MGNIVNAMGFTFLESDFEKACKNKNDQECFKTMTTKNIQYTNSYLTKSTNERIEFVRNKKAYQYYNHLMFLESIKLMKFILMAQRKYKEYLYHPDSEFVKKLEKEFKS